MVILRSSVCLVLVSVLPIVASDQTASSGLGFQCDPVNPEIGEAVVFTIAGIGEVDQATWDFGGPGCAGFTQTYTCNATTWSCMTDVYQYASAGNKFVTLTAKIGSTTYGPVTKTLTVMPTGACSQGGGQGEIVLDAGFLDLGSYLGSAAYWYDISGERLLRTVSIGPAGSEPPGQEPGMVTTLVVPTSWTGETMALVLTLRASPAYPPSPGDLAVFRIRLTDLESGAFVSQQIGIWEVVDVRDELPIAIIDSSQLSAGVQYGLAFQRLGASQGDTYGEPVLLYGAYWVFSTFESADCDRNGTTDAGDLSCVIGAVFDQRTRSPGMQR
jgi:hypothetical protein